MFVFSHVFFKGIDHSWPCTLFFVNHLPALSENGHGFFPFFSQASSQKGEDPGPVAFASVSFLPGLAAPAEGG